MSDVLMFNLNDYDNKTLLITGASGYIASSLIETLSRVNCRIISVSRKNNDLWDSNFWRAILKDVDIIFHLAAQTSIKLANENPPQDMQHNIVPLITLLETCQQHHYSPHIILASSVSIYGLTKQLPVDESQPDNPLTTYCLHKQLAEHYLKYYIRQGVVTGCALRLANVYGPGATASSSDRNILNKMILTALRAKPLTVYGDGNYIRDYVYIDDVANAFLAAGLAINVVNGKHFIISSGEANTFMHAIHTVAKEVTLKTQKDITINNIPLPETISAIDLRNFQGNSQAFCQATAWQAQTPLTQGIRKTVNHYYKINEGVTS